MLNSVVEYLPVMDIPSLERAALQIGEPHKALEECSSQSPIPNLSSQARTTVPITHTIIFPLCKLLGKLGMYMFKFNPVCTKFWSAQDMIHCVQLCMYNTFRIPTTV